MSRIDARATTFPSGGGGGGAVDSVNGRTGAVVLSRTDVNLGNVDNTSDLNKPISTATQSALDLKMTTSVYDSNGLNTDIFNYSVAMAVALG